MALNSLVGDTLQRINTNRCTFSTGHPLAPHQHGAVGGESVCFCFGVCACVSECVSLSVNEAERERTETGWSCVREGEREHLLSSRVFISA